MRYTVDLGDGTTKQVEADRVEVDDGSLVFWKLVFDGQEEAVSTIEGHLAQLPQSRGG